MFVKDEYRTNELSHIKGGANVIVKYKGSRVPYVYNRVKSPSKYLTKAIDEDNDNNIEWVAIDQPRQRKTSMHREEKEKKPSSIQSLAIDFLETRKEPAFRKLMERMRPGLMLFVRKYIGNDKDLCHEIVSQTFVNIWEKINQYNRTFNFSTWAYAIAKNEALGQLRMLRRNVSEQSITDAQYIRIYSNTFTMDLECIGPNGEELTDHLYDLAIKEIGLLEEPYKTVMLEREINKKQLQEIAEDLEMNLNTVKTRLVKARKDIKESLSKKYPELIDAYNESEE